MSLIGPVAAFVLTLWVSHRALRRQPIRDSDVLWICVEYIWLISACLGLLSAGLELARFNHQIDFQTKKANLLNEWNVLRVSTRSRLSVGAIFMEGCPVDAPTQRISADDCRKARSWIQHAADSLELGIDTKSWTDFLYSNADVDPEELSKPPGASRIPQVEPTNFERFPNNLPADELDVAHEVILGMHRLIHLKEESSKAEEATRPQWYDSLLRCATPWLLAIVLPLRIAKNSAQYLKLKQMRENAAIATSKAHQSTDFDDELDLV